jgi:hypothetical protein
MTFEVITEAEQAERAELIEEFMRTHVSRYVLPGKLAAAERKGAAAVSVPVADMVRLLTRVGEHIAPVTEAPDAPTLPNAVQFAALDLVDMMDWEPNGEAILSREQVAALALQVARIAHAAPRARVTRKPAGTVTETVAAAVAAGKKLVSVPTADLARMLETVAARRCASPTHSSTAGTATCCTFRRH